MRSLSIQGVAVPTGGAIRLSMTTVSSGSTVTLSRAVSGVSGVGPYTPLYGPGVPIPAYVDAGDALPSPLVSGSIYVYQLTDGTSTVTTGGIQPAPAMSIQQEPLTSLVISLLQAGINNLIPPSGISSPIKVLQAMPIAALPPLPFVVINPDLIEQSEIPIGQDVERYGRSAQWTKTAFARRMFRISIFAANAVDREWYRDATIAIWEALTGSVFTFIGVDVRHKWIANSGQVAGDKGGQTPGFYYADVMVEIEGTFNITILPTYGRIETITTTASVGGGAAVVATVPLS